MFFLTESEVFLRKFFGKYSDLFPAKNVKILVTKQLKIEKKKPPKTENMVGFARKTDFLIVCLFVCLFVFFLFMFFCRLCSISTITMRTEKHTGKIWP